MPPKVCPTMKSPGAWIHAAKWSAYGASDSSPNAWPAWRNSPDRAAPGLFPPEVVVQVKALACELPSQHQVPLARWSVPEIARQAVASGLVASISDTTVWRWLHQDAIRPWQHRCWIFPRDPDFAAKAGRLLDLYERVWEGQPLREDEFVLSADEKTRIQARARLHAPQPTQSHRPMKVEHEYERKGAGAYLAAWDVHRAKVFGRCEAKSGIAAFDRLVQQVMLQAPYCHARRVFWIVDNGTSHRDERSIRRLQSLHPNLRSGAPSVFLAARPTAFYSSRAVAAAAFPIRRSRFSPSDWHAGAPPRRRLCAGAAR